MSSEAPVCLACFILIAVKQSCLLERLGGVPELGSSPSDITLILMCQQGCCPLPLLRLAKLFGSYMYWNLRSLFLLSSLVLLVSGCALKEPQYSTELGGFPMYRGTSSDRARMYQDVEYQEEGKREIIPSGASRVQRS